MIIFTPYEIISKQPYGYITIEIPTKKYIITLLQNIIMFTFAVVIGIFITHIFKKQKNRIIHVVIFLSVFALTLFLSQFIRTL